MLIMRFIYIFYDGFNRYFTAAAVSLKWFVNRHHFQHLRWGRLKIQHISQTILQKQIVKSFYLLSYYLFLLAPFALPQTGDKSLFKPAFLV